MMFHLQFHKFEGFMQLKNKSEQLVLIGLLKRATGLELIALAVIPHNYQAMQVRIIKQKVCDITIFLKVLPLQATKLSVFYQ